MRIAVWLLGMIYAVSSAHAQTLISEPSLDPSDRLAEVEANKLFENSIRPVLIEQCIRCHGPDKAESGLRLDTSEGLQRGGDSGTVIDRESPEQSMLLRALRYEDYEMPPSRKLPDEQIRSFESWVSQGAKWPEYATKIDTPSLGKPISDEDRQYWFHQPIRNSQAPESRWTHPIDAFVDAKLQPLGLNISEAAPETTLVRRVYLDLVGMPPTWDELQEYLADTSSDRYVQLVDRLLEDRRYGERWGRYWLDLVRFAESDGFKQDAFRPAAYRYRDYVIDSIQSDKPYAQFLTEQLAGDEIDPESDTMNAATGYLRLWIYEYNQRDVRSQWDNILNDLTDVTGEAMLGVSFSCARCHDHKFDPILQKDYYRLQAFFSALEPRYDIPSNRRDYEQWQDAQSNWDQCAAPVLEEMKAIEADIRTRTLKDNIEKFPPDVRPALNKDKSERAPEERPIAMLAYLQIQNDLQGVDFSKRLQGDALERWKQLKSSLDELKKGAPRPPEFALTVRDLGRNAPETRIPGKTVVGVIEPGVPTVLQDGPTLTMSQKEDSTGRRLALANWIVAPENPWTWRVMANRIWQHHFGRGLVANASDFGRMGEPPSHPELLDHLAHYFVEHHGQWKPLHRYILNSATYRQSSYPEQRAQGHAVDAENKWLWRHATRRMDAEQIRDSVLRVTGTLELRTGGPSDAKDSNRRSLYQRVMRNTPHGMLAMFDAPDGSSSVAKRNITTTSLQSLYITNAAWPIQKAEALVQHLHQPETSRDRMLQELFHCILLREPSERERELTDAFLESHETQSPDAQNDDPQRSLRTPWVDLCHALLSSNEFLYVE
jgi:hypothetical protein